MRILLVTSGYPPEKLGGAGLYVKYLAEELSKEHEVHLFVSSRRGREWYDGNVQIHAVEPVTSPWRAILIDKTYRNPTVEAAFRKLLKETKPDVVHLNNIWAFRTGFLPVIAKEFGSVTVQTLHDYWFACPINIMSYKKREPCPGPLPERCSSCWNHVTGEYLSKRGIPNFLSKPFLRVFNRPGKFSARNERLIKALNSIDAVVAPSQFLADVMVKAGVRKELVHVIYNGYPHRVFRDFKKEKDTDRFVFGFVGVPSYQKGTHVAIKAAKLLDGDFELRLYGGGGDKAYVSWLRSIAGNDPRIKFMGRFNAITEPYSKVDVLIFPSLWYENCPLVLAEAALTGTPVIASNLGAIPEFIEHGRNGFLFNPGDWNDLAGYMKIFLDNPGLVSKMVSHRKVPEDMHEHSEKVLELYSSL